MDPTHEPTLRALDAMMAGGDEAILAAQVLQPIYETAGEWDRVVAVYEVMVGNTEDPVKKTELLAKIADIHERRLAAFDAAFDAYVRALRVDPTNPDVVAHLDRLSEVTGRWGDLAAAYESEVERVMDSRQQVEMLLRIGRIYEEETREVEKAIGAYKRVAEAEPDRKDGLVALDRLYNHTQNWADLAEVLRREVRLADTEDQIIEFTYRLAQVLELALGDLPRAVEAYQDILNANPAHAETREALERLLRTGQMQHEIGQVLEPLYRLGEEWDKLVEIYQLDLDRLKDPEERQTLLKRVAEIAEGKLFDQVAAFEWWAKAAMESPSSEQALDELLRLARATHQWDGYVTTMVEAANNAREPSVKRDVLLRLASVFETDLGELQRAEEVLGQILEEHPQDGAALAFLDRIHDKQGNFEQLAEVLRKRIAITDDSKELVGLQLRLGKVLAEVLDEPDGAIAAYNAVLEQESRSPEALDALERLFFRSERWEDLYNVYEKMIDIAPGDEALSDCYARMAKITSDVFGKRDKAIELWRRVLDLRGADPMALAALADLHEQAGEWRELTEVLDNQIRATEDAHAKIPIYKRMGRIWGEKLSRERNSLECWQRVLEIDPGDVEALRAIADNYRSAGAWEELSDTLQRLIDLGPDVIGEAELKELYSQLGELEGSTLMRTQMAIDAWRHVLDIDPTDFRALAALETLFTQEGRWEECVEVLERRAAALATPEDQVDVLMQIADIWSDKIGDGGAAAEVYERVLAVDPSNMTASVELEQLYRQRSNWMKLVELLLARLDFVSDTPERVKLFINIAEVYEQQLGDRDSAFRVLEHAFQEDYSHDHVASELERLATVAGKWNELIGQYTQVVQGIDDAKQASDLWVKIARWYDSALKHTEYAIASAQQALRLDQAHVGALTALEEFYRKQARWRELVETLSRHAEVEQDPPAKVNLLLALADTYETQLGDTAQATAAYQQALEHDERCMDAINALERLHRRTGAWDRLVDVLARKSHIVDDGELAVKLRLQVGDLWEERLGDNARAVEAYREVLTVDPQNLPALKALERLYQKVGNTEAYLDVIEHQLEVTGDDNERVNLYQRMAEVWEQDFEKNDRAIDCLQKVLIIDDRNQRAYRDLERLFRAGRNWDALVENFRRHILVATDPSERIELYSKMGQVYEEELHDPERAIEAFGDVLSFEPDHVDALRGLARLYEQTEQFERAVEVMQRLLPSVEPKEKVDINYRLGKIYDEQMRAPETAEERLIDALSVDPTHVPSMLALLTLYRRRGDSMKAAQLMVRAEANTSNVLEKTRLLFEAGKTYQSDIGDEDKAVELFARTLQLDPEHVEAAEPLAELYFRRQQFAPLVPDPGDVDPQGRPQGQQGAQHPLLSAGQGHRLTGRRREGAALLQAGLRARLHAPAHAARPRQPPLPARAVGRRLQALPDDPRPPPRVAEGQRHRGDLPPHRPDQAQGRRAGQGHQHVREGPGDLSGPPPHAGSAGGHLQRRQRLGGGDPPEARAAGPPAGCRREAHHPRADHPDLQGQDQKPPEGDRRLSGGPRAQAQRPPPAPRRPRSLHRDQAVEEGGGDPHAARGQREGEAARQVPRGGRQHHQLRAARRRRSRGALQPGPRRGPGQPQDLRADRQDHDREEGLEEPGAGLPPHDQAPRQRGAAGEAADAGGALARPRRDLSLAPEGPAGRDPGLRGVRLARAGRAAAPPDPGRAVPDAGAGGLREGPAGVPLHHQEGARSLAGGRAVQDAAAPLHGPQPVRSRLVRDGRARLPAHGGSRGAALLRAVPAQGPGAGQGAAQRGALAEEHLPPRRGPLHLQRPRGDEPVRRLGAGGRAQGGRAQAQGQARPHQRSAALLQGVQLRQPGAEHPQPELFLQPEKPFELEMANTKDKNVLTPAFVVGANLLQGRPEKELAYVLGKKLTMMRADHMVRWPHVVPTVSELTTVFLAALKLAEPKVPIVKPQYEKGVNDYLSVLKGWCRRRCWSSSSRWCSGSSPPRARRISTAGRARWTTPPRGPATSCATISR
jgi:tetratricopeptide (TPR) repeat protein